MWNVKCFILPPEIWSALSIYILYLLQNLNFSVHSINILLGIYFNSSSFISILHKKDGERFLFENTALPKKRKSRSMKKFCLMKYLVVRGVSYMRRSLFYLQSVITEIVLFLLKNISFSSQHFFSFNLWKRYFVNAAVKTTQSKLP